jgi:hypothetical protein
MSTQQFIVYTKDGRSIREWDWNKVEGWFGQPGKEGLTHGGGNFHDYNPEDQNYSTSVKCWTPTSKDCPYTHLFIVGFESDESSCLNILVMDPIGLLEMWKEIRPLISASIMGGVANQFGRLLGQVTDFKPEHQVTLADWLSVNEGLTDKIYDIYTQM